MQDNNKKLMKNTFNTMMKEFFAELFNKFYEILKEIHVDKYNVEKIKSSMADMPQDNIESSLIFGEDQNKALFNLHVQYKSIYKDAVTSFEFINENLDLIIPGLTEKQFIQAYQDTFRLIGTDYTFQGLAEAYAGWEKDKENGFTRLRLDLSIQIANRHRDPSRHPYTEAEAANQKQEIAKIDFSKIINDAFTLVSTNIPLSHAVISIPSKTQVGGHDDEEQLHESADSSEDEEEIEEMSYSYAHDFDGLSTDYDCNTSPNHRAIAISRFNRLLESAESLEEIDELYDASKAYINRHRNPTIDRWFSIEATNSWKTAATRARTKALEKYVSLAEQNAEQAETYYNQYRNKGLFAEKLDTRWFHRFFGQQHSTQAQIKLDECHSHLNQGPKV